MFLLNKKVFEQFSFKKQSFFSIYFLSSIQHSMISKDIGLYKLKFRVLSMLHYAFLEGE